MINLYSVCNNNKVVIVRSQTYLEITYEIHYQNININMENNFKSNRNGSKMRQNNMETARKRDGNSSEMGQKYINGTEMGKKLEGNWMEIGRKCDRYGTKTEKNWDRFRKRYGNRTETGQTHEGNGTGTRRKREKQRNLENRKGMGAKNQYKAEKQATCSQYLKSISEQ
jgi:hypothetical protein